MKKKNILICDINIKKQGHYIGYNQYILDNFKMLEEANNRLHFTFLFNAEAKYLLNIATSIHDRVYFMDDIVIKNSFISRVKFLKKINYFVSQHNVSAMVFMDLDKYQAALALTKLSCTVSGILFRPHHRIISPNTEIITRIKFLLRREKKIVAEKLLLFNKKITKIFILNDQEGVEILNKKHKTSYFHYLSDPIFNYQKGNPIVKKEVDNPYTFLLFGALNERKNTTNIIKAYAKADFPYKTKLLIVGPGSDEYVDYLTGLINGQTNLSGTNKIIEVKNAFVSNEEMEYYFSISDVCLLIYKNFFGSSGLLGRAALHTIKVIGPNVGLLKELITDNDIGITCDPENIETIAESLKNIYDIKVPHYSFQKFYLKYSPEMFLKTLLS